MGRLATGNCKEIAETIRKAQRRRNHLVDLSAGTFNDRDAYIEVKSSKSLRIGDSDFSITAEVYTEKDMRGAFGTIVSKFDPSRRRGLNIGLCSNSSGYNGKATSVNFDGPEAS